jgi:hypothetical protein
LLHQHHHRHHLAAPRSFFVCGSCRLPRRVDTLTVPVGGGAGVGTTHGQRSPGQRSVRPLQVRNRASSSSSSSRRRRVIISLRRRPSPTRGARTTQGSVCVVFQLGDVRTLKHSALADSCAGCCLTATRVCCSGRSPCSVTNTSILVLLSSNIEELQHAPGMSP